MGEVHHHLGNFRQAHQLLLQAFRLNLSQQNQYLAALNALSLSQMMLEQLAEPDQDNQVPVYWRELAELMNTADTIITELDLLPLRSRWQLIQAGIYKIQNKPILANEVLVMAEQLAKDQLDHSSLFDIRRLRIELELLKSGLTPTIQDQLIGLLKDGLKSRSLVGSPLLRSRFNTNLNEISELLIRSLLNQHSAPETGLIQSLYWSEQLKARSLREMSRRSHEQSTHSVTSSLAELIDELQQLHLTIESFQQRGLNSGPQMLELNRQINNRKRSIEQLLSDHFEQTEDEYQEFQWFSDLQQRIEPGQLVLAVRQLGKQSVVWFIDAKGIHHRLLPEGSQFSEQVKRIRAYFKVPRYGAVRMPAEIKSIIIDLSHQLLGDLEVESYHELIFSPHGYWQGFPINALRFDDRLAHLDMSLTPSLLMRRKPPVQIHQQQLLLVSHPAYRNDLTGRDIASLPRSAREADHLVQMYGAAEITRLLAEKANKAEVLLALSQPHKIAHLATHGLFSEQIPELTGLALASEQRNYDLLSVSEIIAADIKADRVVLSACETGLGEAIVDEGLISVGYAFLAGGAREVYATLWPIGDNKAYQDVKNMYQRSAKTGEIQLIANDPAWVKFKFL